jgi:hypothetical protein
MVCSRFLFDSSALLRLATNFFRIEKAMTHPCNDFEDALRLIEASVHGCQQGIVMTQHPAHFKAALQRGQRLTKVMQLLVQLIQIGIAYL